MSAAATHLMLEHAFGLGYRRVEWKCDALNERSRRAALRMGFRFEGVQDAHYIIKGRNRDTAWFRLLDHEWPERRAAAARAVLTGRPKIQGRPGGTGTSGTLLPGRGGGERRGAAACAVAELGTSAKLGRRDSPAKPAAGVRLRSDREVAVWKAAVAPDRSA